MLNHYKVFSRHFKKIGFVKFKLGYTIYDNQLFTESGDKPKTESEDKPNIESEDKPNIEPEDKPKI